MPSAKDLFGQQVKKYRLAMKLSQEKLSEMCDFHRNHIGRIERAERAITFDGIQRLAYVFQVLPAELLETLPIPKRLPPKKKKREQ